MKRTQIEKNIRDFEPTTDRTMPRLNGNQSRIDLDIVLDECEGSNEYAQ